jgi:hypothetical protein
MRFFMLRASNNDIRKYVNAIVLCMFVFLDAFTFFAKVQSFMYLIPLTKMQLLSAMSAKFTQSDEPQTRRVSPQPAQAQTGH